MTDPFQGPELLDQSLTSALGPPDSDSIAAIAAICNEAIATVLGEGLVAELVDEALLWLVAPWVKDLARGLHLRCITGPVDVRTTSLLQLLGRDRVSDDDLERIASSIDVATALHLGDVLEHVLGPGAASRLPAENEERLPWIESLTLGYRVHLVLEFLRLLPSSS